MAALLRDWSVQHFHARRRQRLLRRGLGYAALVGTVAGAILFLSRVAVALT